MDKSNAGYQSQKNNNGKNKKNKSKNGDPKHNYIVDSDAQNSTSSGSKSF